MVNQPPTIEFQGDVYTLVSPLKQVSEAITEGPFYAKPGVDPADWAFMPDVRFRSGQTEKPIFMHCIQQCENPKTPRP